MLWAVRTGVLLVLATPLIVTPDTLFPFVVGKALFSRSIIEITLALWLILIFLYPQHRPTRSWVLLALGLWFLVSLVASFTGVSPVQSLWSNFERMQGVVDRAHWLAFVLISVAVFRTFTDWRLLFTVNLGLCGLVSALGLGQYYGVFDLAPPANVERLEATLGNPTYMAAYAMLSVIIGLGLLGHSFGRRGLEPGGRRIRIGAGRRLRRRNLPETGFDFLPWLRAGWIVAILLCLWALWLTGTRSGVAGLGAGVVVFAVGYIFWGTLAPVRWAAYGILAATILAVAFLLAAWSNFVFEPVVGSGTMLERLTSPEETYSSTLGRATAADAGLLAYRDKPALGWGPDNFLIAWGRYFNGSPRVWVQFDQAHNRIVEEMVATGTIGLLSYLLVWLAMTAVLIRSVWLRRGSEQLLVMAVGTAMVAYYVQNLFLFDTPAGVMLFALLLSFVAAEERQINIRGRANARSRTNDGAVEPEPGRFPAFRIPGAVERWSRGPGVAGARLAGLLRRRGVGAMAVALLMVLTAGSLFLFSVRPYAAAVAAAQGSDQSLPRAERVTYFNRAIEGFPWMANMPRTLLILDAAQSLEDMTDRELAQTAARVAKEGRLALDAEPQNWLLHTALAQFYQVAASRDAQYLEVAGEHVAAAVRLAPKTRPTAAVRDNQVRLEAAAAADEAVPIPEP